MKHLTHLLFSVTEQPMYPEALRWAATLAADAEAQLTVLDVISPIADRHRHVEVDGQDVDLQPLIVDDLTASWAAGVERVLGRPASTEVLTGHPVRTTLEHAERLGADLIVRGELPAPAIVSPVTGRLIREAPVPVLVARPRATGSGPVLAALEVDGGTDDLALSAHVLEVAAALARAHGAPLHVVHAWDVPEEASLRASAFLKSDDRRVDELVHSEREHHRAALDELIAATDCQMLTISTHLVRGDPAEVVVRMARKIAAEVVVIGTVGRRGLRRLVLGNTAEGVLHETEASVLAVTPMDRG